MTKSSSWTLALLFSALTSFTSACTMPPRVFRYDLLNKDGYDENLKGGSTLTGIDKFKQDWGAEDDDLDVETWSQDASAYAVSWGTSGAWQKVSKSFGDIKNLDMLPFITALTFEFSLSTDYDVLGDEYTIVFAVSKSEEFTEGMDDVVHERKVTSVVDEDTKIHPWHRYQHLLELGHYDLTKDDWFHVLIKSENDDKSQAITMADQELFFEIWMPMLDYSWGSYDCQSSSESTQLTLLNIDKIAVGMDYDLTF